jgi:aldose 1-epimerase
MSVERFGRADDADVWEVALRNSAGAEARVLTWGAVLRDLRVPVGGKPRSVVLGLNRIEDYLAHSPYFGAIVGRYANRIGGASFRLGGETIRLEANEGRNQLHGGKRGFGKRNWSLVDHGPAHAALALISPDGDMGYPGRLVATATYTLLEPATLRIALEATADRPTPVNLTTHSYYNLDGSIDVCAHHLQVAADFVTPTEPDLIPTGEIRSVTDTLYDFTTLRPIGAAQLLHCRTSYDINYVLRGQHGGGLVPAATAASRANGLQMELWTTEPGLQFYDGHKLAIPVPGLNGATYGPRSGFCLEPQRFPDGPNRRHFPPCILEPGQVSRQVSEVRFAAS